MKKIGILALALVMALGALGVGYAAWTDTITINGTVNTGDVDLVVVKYSSTYVYKVLADDSIVVRYVFTDAQGATIYESESVPANSIEIASAVAAYGGTDDTVTLTYDNLFPSIDFKADVLIQYQGSIPAKINTTTVFTLGNDTAPELEALWEAGEQGDGTGAWIDWYMWSPADGAVSISEAELYGTQLHDGDYILVVGTIHLPQNDDLMNKSGSFTATFEVVQWNKYPY